MSKSNQLRKAISFVRDAQKGSRKHKYFLKSELAKKTKVGNREDLNVSLAVAEAILTLAWAEQENLESKSK